MARMASVGGVGWAGRMANKAGAVGSKARAAGRERAWRARPAGWGSALIATLLLVLSTACSVRAVDPLGIQVAVEETRLVVDGMTGALLGLPPAARDEVAAEVRLIAEAAHRTLDRIVMQPGPVADPDLAHELSFIADIARALTVELHETAMEASGETGAPLRGSLEPLLGAARARLDLADARLDRWIEHTRDSVVEIESSRGMLVVRSTDRVFHGAVRYASLGLLLLGVLLVGLRLLQMSEERSGSFALFADRPAISGLAALALGVFFVASLMLTISPGTLAALSAEVERQPPEHPCLGLERQRSQLAAAKQIGHAGLVDAVKQRMVEPARDCLGLPSQVAAMEAVTRLAARAGVDPSSAGLAPTGDRTASAALGSAHEPMRTASLDRSAAIIEPTDRANRQEGAGSPAGERAGNAPSAAVRDDGPPKPVLRASPPRERVTTTRVNYRAAPQADANRLGTLAPGTRVTVLEDANGWTEVRLRDGKKVFVASRFLRPTP
jgi:hypothetical protein